MAIADRLDTDELSQVQKGLAWLLKHSSSDETQRLVTYVENLGPMEGTFFLMESDEDRLPGDLQPADTPCIVVAPGSIPVHAWRTSQGKIELSLAILGACLGRTSDPLNVFIMRTLDAIFQRRGRIPDATRDPSDDSLLYDPETQSLDFVQGSRLAGPIQRSPVVKLSRDALQDQEGLGLDDGRWYKWWGFRFDLVVDIRSPFRGRT